MRKLLKPLAFCLAEDREDCEAGLRLALLSLQRHCHGVPAFVYRPNPTKSFLTWSAGLEHVTIIPRRPDGASEWNCKPQALIPILQAGFDRVVWLDSDILVARDCRELLRPTDHGVLYVAQQPASLPDQGTRIRTVGWNFEVGREVAFTLNTAVLQVTHEHLQLLRRWAELLATKEYASSQLLPLGTRPLHLASDQDVLNALLGARDYKHIPLRVIRTGQEIVHVGGALAYSTIERLRNVRRRPFFFHASAGKPWLWLSGEIPWSKASFGGWYRRLLQEMSAYRMEALSYEDQLGLTTRWLHKRSISGTALRTVAFDNHALSGLPLTMVAETIRGATKLIDTFAHLPLGRANKKAL